MHATLKLNTAQRSVKNLAISRADTTVVDIVVKEGREPVDLTGKTLFFTAKRRYSDTDAGAVIRHSTAGLGGITYPDAVGGEAQLTIVPADTVSLSSNGEVLGYDLQLVDGATVTTLSEGTVIVLADVTISTS